jgi:hypothetical protein
MSDLDWAIFIGLSLALLVGAVVWLALYRGRPDDSDPPYRNRGYDPTAQRLPREPAPLPAHGNARQFTLFNIQAGLIHEDRSNSVPQVSVTSDGDTVVITGGKGVRKLVENAVRYGAFGSGPTPKMRIVEDPTLFKKETWTLGSGTRGQTPPSMRHLNWDDED